MILETIKIIARCQREGSDDIFEKEVTLAGEMIYQAFDSKESVFSMIEYLRTNVKKTLISCEQAAVRCGPHGDQQGGSHDEKG